MNTIQAKQKYGLTSFLMLNILEANRSFSMILRTTMCDKLIVIDPQHREMWSPLGRLNQNICRILEANDEMLVALATVLVAISSSGMAFKILFLC